MAQYALFAVKAHSKKVFILMCELGLSDATKLNRIEEQQNLKVTNRIHRHLPQTYFKQRSEIKHFLRRLFQLNYRISIMLHES